MAVGPDRVGLITKMQSNGSTFMIRWYYSVDLCGRGGRIQGPELPPLRVAGHETMHQSRDFVGRSIKGEMAGIQNMYLGLGDITPISFRL